MNYTEALKKVQETKPKDSFIVIKLGYDAPIILPYADGMTMIAAFKQAEQFDKLYDATRIIELDRTRLEFTVLSRQEYERYKIAALLHITVEEAKQLQQPPKPEE